MGISAEELSQQPAETAGPSVGSLLDSGPQREEDDTKDPLARLFGAGIPELLLGMPLMVAGLDGQRRPVTVLNALMRFYQLSPEELEGTQANLLLNRYYSDSYYDKREKWKPVVEPFWGQTDDDSFQAWSKAVIQTARKQVAGLLRPLAPGEAAPAASGQPPPLPSLGAGEQYYDYQAPEVEEEKTP